MRRRHAVRPVLESMEGRMALSVIVGVASSASADRQAAIQDSRARHESLVRLTHPAHHSSKSSSLTDTVTNFFKNVFHGI
jgi:hypothetical protein